MNASLFRWLPLALMAVSISAFSQTTPDVSIIDTVRSSMAVAAGDSILPKAILWLSSLMALQFVITNFGLIKSGADLEAVMGKLIGSFAWFGVCFYLLFNGPDFIDAVGHDLLNTFAPNLPGPGTIIASTLGICTTLLGAIAVTGTSVVGTGNSSIANVLIIVLLTVFSIGMYMAIKVLMISLELALVVLLSPLSFSLLGMNALKDQGIAPLKSLISLAYRVILLGIFCAAFAEVANYAGFQLKAVRWSDPSQWGNALEVILAAISAYPVLAYFVYKSDSIAATLSSGSTNMGTGDVASAAAAGAAAGAAIATGGAAAVAGATHTGQTAGDFLRGLAGSGTSVSNASTAGAGPSPVGPAPTPPVSSLALNDHASNKPPARPATAEAKPSRSTGAGPHAEAATSAKPTSQKGGTPANPSSGAANSASIGAPQSPLEQQVGDLVQALNQKDRKGFRDRLANANEQMAREQATTHVSINTNNTD